MKVSAHSGLGNAAEENERSADLIAQNFGSKRLEREWRTLAAMIECYCHDRHGVNAGLCPECRGLLDYATIRLERCRFGVEKPTCANCPVHCYQRERREQVREVMRYAGPKMLWRNPMLALRHVLDGYRKAPVHVAAKHQERTDHRS